MGEVNTDAGMPFQYLKVCHLGTVVERETAFQVSRERCEQLLGAQPEGFLGSFGDVPDQGIAALAFHERDVVATVLVAPDRITFPVAVEFPVVDGRRSLLNPVFLLQLPLLFSAFGTVLAAKLRVSQILPYGSDEGFGLGPQPAVDGGMGQANSLSCLVGAVVLAQQCGKLLGLALVQLTVLLVGTMPKAVVAGSGNPDVVAGSGRGSAPTQLSAHG